MTLTDFQIAEMLLLNFFLLLSCIPLYEYAVTCLPIRLLMKIESHLVFRYYKLGVMNIHVQVFAWMHIFPTLW